MPRSWRRPQHQKQTYAVQKGKKACPLYPRKQILAVQIAAAQQHANALSIANDAYLSSRSRQIAVSALRHALVPMADSRETVAAGLLMSYGPNQAESFRQVGLYVGHILKGETRLTCRSCNRPSSTSSSI